MKSKNFHKERSNRWTSIGATGLGLAFSFPPFPFPFVSCVALIPLLRRWYHAGDSRTIYLDCFYSFLILFIISFSWPLNHPFTNTAIASLSGVLLIPMTLAIPFAFSLIIMNRLGKRWGLLACCAFFLLIEWTWTHGPIAMPGTLLGHALANQHYVNQVVDITGVAGLSLWILLINFTGMLLLEITPPFQTKLLWGFLSILLIIPPGYSLWRLQDGELASETRNVETSVVAIIQPATSSIAWSDEQSSNRVSRLQHLTDSLLTHTSSKPDLVVWPETAIPVLLSLEDSLIHALQTWSDSAGFALLSGAILTQHSANRATGFTNSAILFHKQKQPQQYDKNWLVPFAEHVPFEQTLKSLSRFRVDAGGVPGYQPGAEQPLMQLDTHSLGVLICFESLFGDYTRRYANKGAAFLVVLSNIGWWGSRIAPAQYLAFSRLRAIESRRSLIINTVTGPALIVDRYGKTVAQSDWMEADLLTATIPHATGRSFYVRYGDWLSILSFLISLLILIRYVLSSAQAKQS